MRIWDVNPGYLNRQSLLGEHREIHGLFSVVFSGKKGYSRHPETLRWYGRLSALKRRHDLLVSEMLLRGYNHFSPMEECSDDVIQSEFVDSPSRQFEILVEKYKDKEPGRIPLPVNCQQLWAQHKYSVLSRDPELYKKLGPLVARDNSKAHFDRLSGEFVQLLQHPPEPGRLLNGLLHMWGYVSSYEVLPQPEGELMPLLEAIRRLSREHDITYLLHSTALCELNVFV
jgi:hypothetical protein